MARAEMEHRRRPATTQRRPADLSTEIEHGSLAAEMIGLAEWLLDRRSAPWPQP